jgi:hypothetical protein
MGGYSKALLDAARKRDALSGSSTAVRYDEDGEGDDSLLGSLRSRLREVAEQLMGPPGSPYGEAANSVVAGIRSMVPGGGTYDDELQGVREGRERTYPGAYSAIDPLRQGARLRALQDYNIGSSMGMAAGPVKVNLAGRAAGRSGRVPWGQIPESVAERGLSEGLERNAPWPAIDHFTRRWEKAHGRLAGAADRQPLRAAQEGWWKRIAEDMRARWREARQSENRLFDALDEAAGTTAGPDSMRARYEGFEPETAWSAEPLDAFMARVLRDSPRGGTR